MDPETTGGATATSSGTVKVMSGANSQDISLGEGEKMTVGDVRANLADVLNIPPTSIAAIGEEAVGDERELKPGETLQFLKQSGSKG